MAVSGTTIGRYHPGLLYSEAASGVPYERALFLQQGVAAGDVASTLRLIAFMHESAHYLHDLSLGLCLNADLLVDRAMSILFAAARRQTGQGVLRCPVAVSGPFPDWDSEVRQAIGTAREFARRASALLDDEGPVMVVRDGNVEECPVSSTHLLEGAVALRTMAGLAARAQSAADRSWLRAIAEDLPILPEGMDDLYARAPGLFGEAVGPLADENGVVRHAHERDWPDSIGNWHDIAYLLTVEVALHVPPFLESDRLVSASAYPAEAFDPVFRFIQAIRILRDEGGFPPQDGRDFYHTLYDHLSDHAGWPNFEHTQSSWEGLFAYLRDRERRSMSDGFRFRAIVERRKQPMKLLIMPPDAVFSGQCIPVIHATPAGLKILRAMSTEERTWSFPYEMQAMPIMSLMDHNAIPWVSAAGEDFQKATEIEFERGLTFLQEIVMRTTGRALLNAMLSESCLCCPWVDDGCHVAEEGCRRIRALGDVPREGCALRRYVAWLRIHPERIIWEEELVDERIDPE
jgi:hypothetical protein